MRTISSFPLLLVLALGCSSLDRALYKGNEVQVYPAGVQATAIAMWEVAPTDVVTARVGWNATDRRGWGEHDDESGGGPGFSLGWRRYSRTEHTGWMYGGRADLWWLDIDWIRRPGTPVEERGDTQILVLQPSLLGGYRWQLGDSEWYLDLTGAFGVEINVSTAGEDVGEGAIGLLGLSLTRSL